jgi:hypothetical protein
MGKMPAKRPPLSAHDTARAREAIAAWRDLIGYLDALNEADREIDTLMRSRHLRAIEPEVADERARVRQKRELLYAVALEGLRGRPADLAGGLPRVRQRLNETVAQSMLEDAVDIVERLLERATSGRASPLAAHDKVMLGEIVRLAADTRRSLGKTAADDITARAISRAIRDAVRSPPASHPDRRGGKLQAAAAIVAPFVSLSAEHVERVVRGRRRGRRG